ITEHDLGEVFFAHVDIIFTMTDVVQPDILFIAKQRLNIITKKNVVAAPDLAVEILSESTQHLDREKKKDLYLRQKVKEYWIVDPEARSVEQFIQSSDKYKHSLYSGNNTFTSPVVDGLAVT